ncbi:MAG: hypothetical protein IKY52_02345 [Clostridia bacterium]|nr:hypothetical protein [Clostridia bacterium]
MELSLFLEGLKTSLVKRGIPPEVAAKHAASLGRTFTEEDLAEIKSIRSPSEIEPIADSIAAIINKNKAARPAPAQTRPAVQDAPTTVMDAVPPAAHTEAGAVPVPREQKVPEPRPQPKPVPTPRTEEPVRPAQNSADFFTTPEGDDKTPKGVATFWALFVLTLPLTLALFAGILVIFGGLFLGLIAIIIGLVAAMIAVAAAGSGIALVGIIYGITQLFTFMAAGIYEIGLGVMIGGGVLLASIILYNLAVRFLPWVMKWLTVLFSFVFGQCRNLFYLARRECYKL